MVAREPGAFRRILDESRNFPGRDRAAFFESACAGDEELLAQIGAHLREHPEEAEHAPAGGTDLPSSVGPYHVMEQLGEGGAGVVYLAEQQAPLRRRVAVKLIKAGMDTREVLTRFEAERQALALMNHPNVAQVLDAGSTGEGRPYFVMEHVPGVRITEYCDRECLAIPERLKLFLAVCDGIHHAHQKGIIHRDIKPSNILVALDGGVPVPKIIDFGVAKATNQRLTEHTLFTEQGCFIGTPAYMSPEQWEYAGQDIDIRADVYSLGVLLYELLSGHLPFDPARIPGGFAEIQRAIREKDPPTPSTWFTQAKGDASMAAAARGADGTRLARQLRGDLDWITGKALEKDRERRYGSASELAADVERHLEHEPVLAGPPGRAYQLRKFVRKNRGLVAATAFVFVALTGGLAVASYGLVEANHQRGVAAERATQLQEVADFQAHQLAGLDVPRMGVRLRQGLLDAVRASSAGAGHSEEEVAARAAEVEKVIAGANFTDLALASLNENIFERTSKTIDEQFAGQPLVRAQLLQTLADTLRDLGLLQAVVAPQETALDIRRRLLGNEHPDTITSINNLGGLFDDMGKLGEAELLHREALELCRGRFGNDDPHTLTALDNLGNVLENQGKLTEAEACSREALEASRRVLGNEHPDTLVAIANLGDVLVEQGKLAEAEPYLREALEGGRRVLGNEHRVTLSFITNMGDLLERQGKLADAEPYMQEAVDTSRRTLGNDHPATLGCINNLGSILQSEGKVAEAEIYFREALATRRRVLGDEHIETLRSINNLAMLLDETGRTAEAETQLREALAVCRRVLGNEHSLTTNIIGNVASVLRDQGRFDEAELCAREALETQRRVLGDEHPDTLISIVTLGLLLHEQGKSAEAEPLFREVMEASRRVLGDEHPDTVVAINNMAGLLAAQEKFDAAEPLFREAMETSRRTLGDEHPTTVVAINNMGFLLLRQRKLAEAEKYLRESSEACRRVFGTKDERTLTSMQSLAAALRGQKKFESAAQQLEAGHHILAASFGDEDSQTMDAVRQLTACYEEWHAAEPGAGHDAKAAEWRSKLREPGGAADANPSR